MRKEGHNLNLQVYIKGTSMVVVNNVYRFEDFRLRRHFHNSMLFLFLLAGICPFHSEITSLRLLSLRSWCCRRCYFVYYLSEFILHWKNVSQSSYKGYIRVVIQNHLGKHLRKVRIHLLGFSASAVVICW